MASWENSDRLGSAVEVLLLTDEYQLAYKYVLSILNMQGEHAW